MAKPTAVKYNTKQGVRWKGKYHCIDDRCRSRIKHGHCRGHTDGLSGFKTKGEAVAAATRRQSEVQSTGLTTVDKKKVILDDVAREYFDSAPDIKNTTLNWYRSVYYPTITQSLGHLPVVMIDEAAVHGWLQELRHKGLTKNTMIDYRKVLSRMLKFAISPMGINDVNRATGVDLPKAQTEPKKIIEFTEDELWEIAFNIREEYRLFVLFGGFCGLRIAEDSGVRRDDLEWREQSGWVLHVRKQVQSGKLTTLKTADSVRDVPVPPDLWEMIETHLRLFPPQNSECGVLFPSPQGKLLNANNFRRREWYPALQRAGIEKRHPHVLRHTFIKLCKDADMPPHVVAKLAGQKSLAVTMNTYGTGIDLDSLVTQSRKLSGVLDEDSFKKRLQEADSADFAADFAAEPEVTGTPGFSDVNGNPADYRRNR